MSSTIKFGIIGCGYIAERHIEHIINHPQGEAVAVYDIDKPTAINFGQTFKTPHFETLEAFLNSEVQIVCICTPNGSHAQIAIECLKAGKDVLVEKPMATNTADAREIIAVAEKHNRQLFIVKQNRYNPPVAALKELIDTGKLGEIYSVNINCYWNRNADYYKLSSWKGTKKMDGGVLFTQFSHFIDILYYFFGDVNEVCGRIANKGHNGLIEFEDTGTFNFQLENGALGSLNFTTCAYNKNMEGSITVFAEKATFKIGGKYLNTIDYQETDGFDLKHLPQSAKANNYGYYQGSMSNHDKVIDNVIQTLNHKADIMTGGPEGLKVVEIIEKFYKSAKQL